MKKSRKGIRRNKRTQRNARIICNRQVLHRVQTERRNQVQRRKKTQRRNRIKGGNYDTDITTDMMELVPMKSKDVVISMPGHVLSAKDYKKHMEYMDFQGSS